jgi:hypothetical protein
MLESSMASLGVGTWTRVNTKELNATDTQARRDGDWMGKTEKQK